MVFKPFVEADFASDLFWPRLQAVFADVWTQAALPGSPPVLPLYDKSEGWRLRKINSAFATIWAELDALDGVAVAHIEPFYHSPAIALIVYNSSLALVYAALATGNHVLNFTSVSNSQYLALLENAA